LASKLLLEIRVYHPSELSSIQLLQVVARLFLALFEKSNAETNFSSLQIRHFLLMGIGFAPSLNLDINGLSELVINNPT
jgi:hypothetical protein